MNDNLYSWHEERMVQHEMREDDRAVQQARLLKEVGGSQIHAGKSVTFAQTQ